MKKSIYLLMTIAAAVFTSCEPMEDIYSEVDATIENTPNAGTVTLTVTDADFTTEKKEGGLEMDRTYFESVAEANDSLPPWLNEKFPQLGKGSIANVTVEIAEPIDALGTVTQYEVTSDDYKEYEHKYGNFDAPDQIITFLKGKFADLPSGDVVELTYKYYEGKASVRTGTFLKMGDSWIPVMILEREDYTAMGQAFPNFNNREEAMQKLPVYLSQMNPFAMEGASETVVFMVHIGGGVSVPFLKNFVYDGQRWESTFDQTLQYGHNGTTWEPDNTILYTMDSADFKFISDAFADVYEDPAWSAGNYSNFDRRKGNPNYWSDAMLLEAVNVLLSERVAPNAAEGQKYLVSFKIYNNADGVESLHVIKQGDAWILF